MSYKSINPATQTLMKTYPVVSDNELFAKLELAQSAFTKWEQKSLNERLSLVKKLAELLLEERDIYATLITSEMGKPITQSRAEIEKCALLCDYYAEQAESLLKPVSYISNARRSYIRYDAMGVIYGVMPWNFPFWQVFRFFIPNIVLGNTTLLKHASNVPQCAEAIENIILKARFPEGVFQNLFIDYSQSEDVISSKYVWGVTLTGSEGAGSRVAATAGKYIKKTVLELGGSDPFIVLADADIDKAVESAIISRMQNAGQSCIAAKRFIVHHDVYDIFVSKYIDEVQKLKLGNPMDEDVFMGPLATATLAKELEEQIAASTKMGAKVLCGGRRLHEGSLFFMPTVLSDISVDMPAYHEEIFGPVALMFKVKTIEEAVSLANDTVFGLGASVWTKDEKTAVEIAEKIRTGTVAVNAGVRSEPRLPFGGTKMSGYGRELGDLGLKEFANIKTINVF